MVKNGIIKVGDIDIRINQINQEDFICLTDMTKGKESDNGRSDMVIQNWMRLQNTIDFLAIWEKINNPNFNPIGFDGIKNESGLNNFVLTPKRWIEKTNAIGIISKAGRYGGTYAHKDIAFEFGTWISPTFKYYLIQDYQRLKEAESNQYGLEWNVKRILSKTNYTVQTDAIQEYIIPHIGYTQKKEWIYANEADMLNIIMFGCTAKQWREANMDRVMKGENIRDMASIDELAILSTLEGMNGFLISQGLDRKERAKILNDACQKQRKALGGKDFLKSVKKLSDRTYIESKKEEPPNDDFDKGIDKILGFEED